MSCKIQKKQEAISDINRPLTNWDDYCGRNQVLVGFKIKMSDRQFEFEEILTNFSDFHMLHFRKESNKRTSLKNGFYLLVDPMVKNFTGMLTYK